MTPEARSELQRLLSGLCDGALTDAQHARLTELLDADADCRRLYLEYVDLHARLLVHPGFSADGPLPPTEGGRAAAEAPPPPARRRRGWAPQALRYALVAAGAVAASLLVQAFCRPPWGPGGGGDNKPAAETPRAPGYVATLTQTADCAWEGGPLRLGARLLPGDLRLRQGAARVHFDGGPDLVIEGPAEVRLDSGTAATVLQGKVVFQGDETAAPFDLHTPAATLVDFGTEYAVSVGPEGEEVHVFDGEVRRTPAGEGPGEAERLTAGQALRYDPAAGEAGRAVPLDPAGFKRQVDGPGGQPLDPAAGLLAYEGFDYRDPDALRAGKAAGGVGWVGPWKGFARPAAEGDAAPALDLAEGLGRPGAAVPAVGGCFRYTGFTKYYRRLAVPVRMDADGVYYLSWLFRRDGPSDDPVNTTAVLLRTSDEIRKEDPRRRLNVGVGRSNRLFTFFDRASAQTPLPLRYGETYLLVAKVVAAADQPDQVFVRVYGQDEPIDRAEPDGWSVVGAPFESDLVFDWLEVHINSKTRQAIDEIRVGLTWASVTAPWRQ
jgi:hypothetical protein